MSQCISWVVLLGHLVWDALVRAGNGRRLVLQRFLWSLFNLLFDSPLNLDTHKDGGQVLLPWELKALPCRALFLCQKKTIGPGQALMESSSVITQQVSIPSLESRQEPLKALLWIPPQRVGPNPAPRHSSSTVLNCPIQALFSTFCFACRSDEGFKTKRIPFFTTKNRVRGGPEAGKVHSGASAESARWAV